MSAFVSMGDYSPSKSSEIVDFTNISPVDAKCLKINVISDFNCKSLICSPTIEDLVTPHVCDENRPLNSNQSSSTTSSTGKLSVVDLTTPKSVMNDNMTLFSSSHALKPATHDSFDCIEVSNCSLFSNLDSQCLSFQGQSTDTTSEETDMAVDVLDMNQGSNEIESFEAKQRREFEESERLAWEIMRQEEAELYQLQVTFMQQNSQGMTQEDLVAIQMVVNESGGNYQTSIDTNQMEEDDDEVEEGDDPETWDYDRLLELGQTLGDVKTERWKLKARSVIKSLPTLDYQDITPDMNFKMEAQCIICMEPYQSSCVGREQNDGSINASCVVKVLPCKHFFHDECISNWLTDHNKCPLFCKLKVSLSP